MSIPLPQPVQGGGIWCSTLCSTWCSPACSSWCSSSSSSWCSPWCSTACCFSCSPWCSFWWGGRPCRRGGPCLRCSKRGQSARPANSLVTAMAKSRDTPKAENVNRASNRRTGFQPEASQPQRPQSPNSPTAASRRIEPGRCRDSARLRRRRRRRPGSSSHRRLQRNDRCRPSRITHRYGCDRGH